ncbi:30S ribosomal protein S9 [Thermostilla marina]
MAEQVIIEGKGTNDFLGTGRRKASVARVRIRPGQGRIAINRRSLEDYFPLKLHQNAVLEPLKLTERLESVDVIVRVNGGGLTGQADAIKLGIARALKNMDPELEKTLRDAGLLTRDARVKERKKYGLHGARRGTQFSKR